VGDNGKRFTFLFKGLEDLHLDERIMQFLGMSSMYYSVLRIHVILLRIRIRGSMPPGPDLDLDPRIFVIDLQDAKKTLI
jgi:hypothetical protein